MAATAAIMLEGCERGEGLVNVRFSWGSAGRPAEPTAALFARVSEVAVDPATGGPLLPTARTLAAASPVLVDRATTLEIPSVPHGDRRVAILEVRESIASSSELLLYGYSAAFSIGPGSETDVEVAVDLRSPPASIGGVAIATGTTAAEALSATATVVLTLTTDTGVRAELSNFETMPSDGTRCFGLGVEAEGCERAEAIAACSRIAGARCEHRVTWDLNLGIDDDCGADPARGFERRDRCPRRVFARFVDESGVASNLASVDVVLDTKSPALEQTIVIYQPSPGAVLQEVEAARFGASVSVALLAREAIRPLPVMLTAIGPEQRTIELHRVEGTLTALGARYAATIVDPTQPDGAYTLAPLELIDLAGNAGIVDLFGEPIEVKASRPSLVIRQDRVSYLRAPFVNTAEELLGDHTVPAGPAYFALASADPLDGTRSFAADTFLVSGAPAAALRVFADASMESLLLPLVRPDSGGTWPLDRLRLPNLEATRIYVTGLDVAGNESSPVGIESAWYVGSPAIRAGAPSPHALTVSDLARFPRSEQRSVAPSSAISALDGIGVERVAGLAWLHRARTLPSGRFDAFVWDSARGEVIGIGLLPESQTWSWNGVAFTNVTPRASNLPAGYLPAIAHDAARGRVVVFGGASYDETWEWDGHTWREIATSVQPSPRFAAAMSYDPVRGVVVLFGGVDELSNALRDTWTWDGVEWTDVTPASGSPTARFYATMAFDVDRGQAILFGGTNAFPIVDNPPLEPNQTWAWDGVRWSDVTPAAPSPEPRIFHALAYDEARGRIVVSGGLHADWDPANAFTDTWEWDGTRWSRASITGAQPYSMSAYDGRRGQVVMWGGEELAQPVLRAWDGAAWRVASPGLTPPPRTAHDMVYDSVRRRTVMFGGNAFDQRVLAETWELDGDTWILTATTGPSPRTEHAMAFDEARGRVVLFSGYNQIADTWTWDGSTWTLSSTASGPPARFAASMVYDAERERVVLFGGYAGTPGGIYAPPLDDTWLWDGRTWTEVDVALRPPGRAQTSLAFDSERRRVVMYGGYMQTVDLGGGFVTFDAYDDTWEWDGERWIDVSPPSGAPGTRAEHQLVFDPRLGLTLLCCDVGFGGVWGWDGAAWTNLTPADAGPPPRAGGELVHDGVRGSSLLFGGSVAESDIWELAPRLPAVQLSVAIPEDVELGSLSELRVRAFCGGDARSGAGAQLLAWTGVGASSGWQPLAENEAPLALDANDPHAGSLESFSSARTFVSERDRAIYLQCRAKDDDAWPRSRVSVDYFEARIRYRPRDD